MSAAADLHDQVAQAIKATRDGRYLVNLIVRNRRERGLAGYLLARYGGHLASFVTVKTRAEAGPEWARLTGAVT